MKSSRLEIPKEWTFRSHAIANSFDDHVREQLPWYDSPPMRSRISVDTTSRGGRVYDIGASTGNIGRALIDTLRQRQARFTAIEESRRWPSATRDRLS
jgi:tRNA (cmo5U34)-methyltransferase